MAKYNHVCTFMFHFRLLTTSLVSCAVIILQNWWSLKVTWTSRDMTAAYQRGELSIIVLPVYMLVLSNHWFWVHCLL